MVNNQIEFNNKYSKETEEIEIEYEDFQGQLTIENYSELEKLYLKKVDNIDKITFENLEKLEECTIWSCGVKDLVIKNCPQIKKLNVRGNLLSSLKFLKDLENLEELEIDDNTEISLFSGIKYLPNSLEKFSYKDTKLIKFLEPEWKTYKEEIQKLVEKVKQDPQKLAKKFWDLDKRHKYLKSVFPKNSQGVNINTEELIKIVKGEEEKNLEKMKGDFVAKRIESYNLIDRNINKEEKLEKIQESLNTYLVSIKDSILSPNTSTLTLKEKEKKYLLKGKSELVELLNKLGEKQQEIILLENQTSSSQVIQLSQTTQITATRIRRESEGEKALVYKAKKDRIQIGIPTPLGLAGVSGERDRSTLTVSEKYKQQNQEMVVGLEQKLVEQQLGIQENPQTQSSLQAQIEIPPK